jgi:hypothetical protein
MSKSLSKDARWFLSIYSILLLAYPESFGGSMDRRWSFCSLTASETCAPRRRVRGYGFALSSILFVRRRENIWKR